METLILMFDTAVILAIVVFSLRNEKRPPDTPEFGPFRIKPQAPRAAPARVLVPVRRRRIRGL